MALGNPNRKRRPLNILAMLAALVISAFVGAAAGLVWQSSDWLSEPPEDEMVTNEQGEG